MNNIDYATHYEAISPFDGGFRIGFSTFAKLTTMRPHWHEHLEFVYITAGIGTFIINGKRFSVTPGDLIVANPNTLHALLSEHGIDYHCLLVFLDFFDKDDIDVLCFQSLVQGDATVSEIFDELEGEYKNGNTAASLMKKSLVYRLVAHLARNYVNSELTKADIERRTAAFSRMRKIEDFVSENYKNKIGTADLAKMFFVSENHFCRLFKKTVGISAVDYINEYRISKAEILLDTTDLAITEIASAVGFDDANYFSRIFKKVKKLSPSEYRKQSN